MQDLRFDFARIIKVWSHRFLQTVQLGVLSCLWFCSLGRLRRVDRLVKGRLSETFVHVVGLIDAAIQDVRGIHFSSLFVLVESSLDKSLDLDV